MAARAVWRIAVDTGGTFTDCLGIDPEGRQRRAKLLSSGALKRVVSQRPSPRVVVLAGPEIAHDGFFSGWTMALGKESIPIKGSNGNRLELAGTLEIVAEDEVVLQSPEEAALTAIRWITETRAGQTLPPMELRLATTRGTNALLERKGAEVAFFVTRGFRDLLDIGNQQRPDLFALEIRKPDPLYAEVVEVDERLDADGMIVRALDEAALARQARRQVEAGRRFAAIAFVHSFRNSGHEDRATQVLENAGFRHVSRSSTLSRRVKILPRAQTALVDAYLAETMGRYLDSVARPIRSSSLHVMTSAGGLVRASEYRPKDSLLSGPAAGVVGAVASGLRSGCERLIAFDMGGTSTDVSRFGGELELRAETVVGRHRLLSPSVAVETVASGGGSICRWQAGRPRVGPQSAGANPGPACYGAGGPLTLTDVNLLLGRLVTARFPFRVDLEAAGARAREVGAAAGRSDSPAADTLDTRKVRSDAVAGQDEFLAGFLAIANERMAGAIRAISIRRGYDPREYTLVAFGGAGAQHAVAIADLLGIGRVLVPADGALLSAAGLSEARLERWAERQVLDSLPRVAGRLDTLFQDLSAEARAALEAEGVNESAVENGPATAFLRYQGQESTLAIEWREGLAAGELVAEFESAYLARYGYLPGGRVPEVESLRLSMRSTAGVAPGRDARRRRERTCAEAAQRFWDGGEWVDAPVLERTAMAAEQRVAGPCLIVERHTVTVVENHWRAQLETTGELFLRKED